MDAYRTSGRKIFGIDGLPSVMDCPRGHGALTPEKLDGGFVLHFCGECGGVFVTHGAFFRIRNIEETQVEIFAQWLASLTKREVDPTASAYCPACSEFMERLARPEHEENISLDACNMHGVWFDGGELEAARAHGDDGMRDANGKLLVPKKGFFSRVLGRTD